MAHISAAVLMPQVHSRLGRRLAPALRRVASPCEDAFEIA